MYLKLDELEIENLKQFVGVGVDEADKAHLLLGKELPFMEAMQMIQTLTHHTLSCFIETHPDAREDVWDCYNFMASSLLETLMPDKPLRGEITTEAIMELEAQKIKEQFDSLSDEEKAEALANLDVMKDMLASED